MNDGPRIEKLRREHHVDLFDCGQEALNRFLARSAFQNQQAEALQTHVALVGDEVAGWAEMRGCAVVAGNQSVAVVSARSPTYSTLPQ